MSINLLRWEGEFKNKRPTEIIRKGWGPAIDMYKLHVLDGEQAN